MKHTPGTIYKSACTHCGHMATSSEAQEALKELEDKIDESRNARCAYNTFPPGSKGAADFMKKGGPG